MAASNKTTDRPRHAQAAQAAKIHRSTVLIVLLGVALAAGMWRFVYGAQAAVRDSAAAELAAVQADVAREEQDLAAVRGGDPDSLRSLHARVSALDRTVPTEIDGLELAVWLESTIPAGLSGLVVPDPGAAVEVDGLPGMAKVVLPVTAQGPRSSLLGWVAQLQAAPDRLITVESATITSTPEGDGASTLTMSLAVWKTTEPLLVPPQAQPAAPDAPAPADTLEPTGPAAATEPTAPTGPTEPSEPGGSADPEVTVDPADPADPAEPTATVDPAEPGGQFDLGAPAPSGTAPPAP